VRRADVLECWFLVSSAQPDRPKPKSGTGRAPDDRSNEYRRGSVHGRNDVDVPRGKQAGVRYEALGDAASARSDGHFDAARVVAAPSKLTALVAVSIKGLVGTAVRAEAAILVDLDDSLGRSWRRRPGLEGAEANAAMQRGVGLGAPTVERACAVRRGGLGRQAAQRRRRLAPGLGSVVVRVPSGKGQRRPGRAVAGGPVGAIAPSRSRGNRAPIGTDRRPQGAHLASSWTIVYT